MNNSEYTIIERIQKALSDADFDAVTKATDQLSDFDYKSDKQKNTFRPHRLQAQ